MTGTGDKQGASGKKRTCFKVCLRVFVFVLVLAVFAGVVLGVAAYLIYEHVTGPGTHGQTVRVTIPLGVTGAEVGTILAENDLVEYPELFRLAIHLDGSGKTIKHGAYALPRGASPMELLHMLYDGPNAPLSAADVPDENKLIVPEGLTIAQMAALFDNPQAFVEAAASRPLLQKLGVQADTLEGFLMPETYFFDAKPTPEEAVERMVAQFQTEYAALLERYPEAVGKDLLEVVTVASLVEEETREPPERPIVAAVIYNRLEKKMPLGLDCTLQYALGKYGQRMLTEDKEVDSPYNTYVHAGLPPGPISNPGVAAIEAALVPADVDYLYFVSNADGKTHTFSKTMQEHNQAVRLYRQRIATQRRELQQQNANGETHD